MNTRLPASKGRIASLLAAFLLIGALTVPAATLAANPVAAGATIPSALAPATSSFTFESGIFPVSSPFAPVSIGRGHVRFVNPPTPTPPPPPAGPYKLDLYRNGIFLHQPNWITCNPTVVRMMLNIISGKGGPSVATLYAQGLGLQRHYPWPGLDPQAQAALLNRYAGSSTHWTVDNATSFTAALNTAVTRMAITGKPVALFVANGNHSWMLNGFVATHNPALTGNFKVTGVYVTGPLYGMQSKNGYDSAPNHYLTTAQFAGFLTRYDDHGQHNVWYGHYVTVNP